jgi:hypothetical protein
VAEPLSAESVLNNAPMVMASAPETAPAVATVGIVPGLLAMLFSQVGPLALDALVKALEPMLLEEAKALAAKVNLSPQAKAILKAVTDAILGYSPPQPPAGVVPNVQK